MFIINNIVGKFGQLEDRAFFFLFFGTTQLVKYLVMKSERKGNLIKKLQYSTCIRRPLLFKGQYNMFSYFNHAFLSPKTTLFMRPFVQSNTVLILGCTNNYHHMFKFSNMCPKFNLLFQLGICWYLYIFNILYGTDSKFFFNL